MTEQLQFRIAGRHYQQLRDGLFPGDGLEVVAVALCGRHPTASCETLLVQEVHLVPVSAYRERRPDRVRWATDWLIPLLEHAAKKGLAVVKFHSHPGGYAAFSELDDEADAALFPSVHSWVESVPWHASAIMLPDGELIARGVRQNGSFVDVERVTVVGDRIRVFEPSARGNVAEHAVRHAQALGASTTALMQRLRIGVVGCSGTGSFVVELLARLGAYELVLVDPEQVGVENLNRIIWATRRDVGRLKVDVARDHVDAMGLGSVVVPFARGLADAEAVEALASCDAVFGCVDSHDGRRLLNRLAAFYLVPYIDVGVRIDADGTGGIEHISGAVHYLQPGGSSLLSRGAISNQRATEEARLRSDPKGYAEQVEAGYLRGVVETRPAVVSINGAFASQAVTELLARLHGFRADDDDAFAQQRFVVTTPCFVPEADGVPCPILSRHVGRGQVQPLLDMPELSVRR